MEDYRDITKLPIAIVYDEATRQWEVSKAREFIETTKYFIDKLPSIITCKNCKHAKFYACKNDYMGRYIICEYDVPTTDENFYCAYAERRETAEA